MGRVFDTHGRNEECIQNFCHKPNGRINLADLGVDRKIMLKWIIEKKDVRM